MIMCIWSTTAVPAVLYTTYYRSYHYRRAMYPDNNRNNELLLCVVYGARWFWSWEGRGGGKAEK